MQELNQERKIEEIEGSVEHIVYRNPQNGFTVMEINVGGTLMSAVGEISDVQAGEEVTLTGYYTQHPSYGDQFHVEMCVKRLPSTASAICRYLEGGAVKGIGPAMARRITEKFGDASLDVIENEPERLAQVKGISAARAHIISREFKRTFGVRAAMAQLSGLGLTPGICVRVWKKYGERSSEMIRENPYLLCAADIGVAFDKADSIAAGSGIANNDKNRVCAGVRHILRHNLGNGHTCLPLDKLTGMAQAMLEVEAEDVDGAIAEDVLDRELVRQQFGGREYVYLPQLYEAESYVAGKLELLNAVTTPRREPDAETIARLERSNGITYDETQREAIRRAATSSVFILTGGPGTGKTTILNAIIQLAELQGESVALAAPTGRASKRMSEVTGRDAKTIHRLLEVDFAEEDSESGLLKFKRNEKNPLKNDLIVIDEMSMVDILLFEALLRAVRMTARLVLVGDSDQLPSVSAGSVLRDMIVSGRINTVQLKHVFRQAASSLIVTNAHRIVSGEQPVINNGAQDDFFLMRRTRAEDIEDTVAELCARRLPQKYGISGTWDVQVLAPGRKGPTGVAALNNWLQGVLNPQKEHGWEQRNEQRTLRKGDKVMQTRNNYDIEWTRYKPGTPEELYFTGEAEIEEQGAGIFNGDIGRVLNIDREERCVDVIFDDRVARYTFESASELELAYAVTVHKSQGSEYSVVILVLSYPNERLYYRSLLYTAVTRAKKLMIVVGRGEALGYMVNNNRRMVRYSNLRKLLAKGAGENEDA